MAYRPLTASKIVIKDANSNTANLSNTIFISTHAFTKNRVTSFVSMDEVNSLIPKETKAYTALSGAFQQPVISAPVYLGRRQADSMTITPNRVLSSAEYGFTLIVYDKSDYTEEQYDISVASDTSAIATEITNDLVAAMDDISNVDVVNNTGSLTVSALAGYDFYVKDLSTRLTATFETTEEAGEVFDAVLSEGNDNWYFVTADDHTNTFIKAMANTVESTENSDYPKYYMYSVSDNSYLQGVTDPATTVAGELNELGFDRTGGRWDQDDDKYPEVKKCVYIGGFDAGTIGWKGLPNMVGIPVASSPITGVDLDTASQGYIGDHNLSWWAKELGVAFEHGGKSASGEWGDIIRGKDWIKSEQRKRLQDMWLNEATDGKLSYTPDDLKKPLNVIDSVNSDAVDREILEGFEPASYARDITAADKIERIIDSINWTGYLAGAVYFMVTNGVLTYRDTDVTNL